MNDFTIPRIITKADLDKAVLPHIMGYEWAVNALEDLWRMSSPTPESLRAAMRGIPFIETRILYPSLFKQWWADVQQRRGITLPLDSVIPVR